MSAAFWALGRGTGVVALVLFTVALVLGIVARSGRPVPWLGRFGTSDLHRTAALTGDRPGRPRTSPPCTSTPTRSSGWWTSSFPFLGAYRPLWLGLGTLALDLLGVVTVVSLLRHRVGPRVFRTVHWATYALWPVALLHALGNGTDGGSTWFRAAGRGLHQRGRHRGRLAAHPVVRPPRLEPVTPGGPHEHRHDPTTHPAPARRAGQRRAAWPSGSASTTLLEAVDRQRADRPRRRRLPDRDQGARGRRRRAAGRSSSATAWRASRSATRTPCC